MILEFECGGEKIRCELDDSAESKVLARRIVRLSKTAPDLRALVDSCFEEILRDAQP